MAVFLLKTGYKLGYSGYIIFFMHSCILWDNLQKFKAVENDKQVTISLIYFFKWYKLFFERIFFLLWFNNNFRYFCCILNLLLEYTYFHCKTNDFKLLANDLCCRAIGGELKKLMASDLRELSALFNNIE